MNLISRYLFKDILYYFGMFVLIFVVIMLVNESFDSRQAIMEQTTELGDFVLFLILSVPEKLSQVLPLIGLLGTTMAYGLLAKNREILAMLAAGVSFRRLAAPALIFGLGFSVFSFWFNEAVVPACTVQAYYLEKVTLKGRSETVLTKRRNLFVKGVGDRFYFMQEYLSEQKLMAFPTILEVAPDGNGLRERIEARQARLVSEESGRRYWEFEDAEQWSFKPDGSLASYQKYDGPFQLPMEEDLDKFLSRNKRPEEMTLFELVDYVRLLSRRGGGETIERYVVSMHQKMAFPISCLLMTLLGFAAVLDLNARRFARGTLKGLVIAIGYYLVEAALRSLGEEGYISTFLAGWAALLLFAGVVALLIQRLERIGN